MSDIKYTEGFAKVKTLRAAKADARVWEIAKCDAEEFGSAGYEINLADGYEFDEGGGLIYAETVSEVCELVNNHICYA